MATLTYHATKNRLKINFPEKKPLNLLICILFIDIEKKKYHKQYKYTVLHQNA